jgi:hypothetical protein
VVQLGVLAPELVEDEKKFLCSSEGKYRKEDAAAALDDVLNEGCEETFSRRRERRSETDS